MADSTAPAAATTPLLPPPATADHQPVHPANATAAPAPPRAAPPPAVDDALRGLQVPTGDDAAPLAVVAAMWANQAASGASVAARWACGEGSPAEVLATHASRAAFVAMGLLLPLAFQRLLAHRFNVARAAPAPRQARRREVQRRSPPARIGLGWDGRLALEPMLVILFCCVLMAVQWLVPAKGTWFDKVGTGLGDLGIILASLTFCWILFPNLAIILMRE